ncbi:MAG: InlB B-repeat-containing protein, partial [Eubacteriales bacterium]
TITGGIFYGRVNGSGTIRDSAKVTMTFNSDGDDVAEQKVLRGQKATAPTDPTKEDCTFVGWYNGDNLYDFSTPVTENITLIAKWTVDRVKLTKDILDEKYKEYSVGVSKYVLPSGNYYLGDNISVVAYIDIGSYTSKTQNVVLDLNGYTLKNDTNSIALLCPDYSSTLTLMDSSSAKTGKVISSSGDAVYIGSNSKLNANGGTVEGNINLRSDNAVIDNTDPLNVTIFRNGQIYGYSSNAVINGGIFYSTVGTVYDYSGQITGGIFYGAVNCDKISDSAKVTVTFDSDSGSDITEQKVLRGQKATAPTAPTKAGYDFVGWYQGNTEFDFANTPVIGNIALTAKWSEKPSIPFSTAPQSYTYDGVTQAFSITGTSVTGFDIAYQQNGQTVTNPTNAGSYDVIITRAADNTYKAVNETITNGLVINPKDVTATISPISDQTYTGSDIEPAVTVYDGTTEIPASEYTVSYINNRNAGTATVTLTDVAGGNYTVSGSATFEIKPKTVTATISAISDKTYTGSDIEPAITVYDGTTEIPASEYTVSYTNNRNAGTATVTLADVAGGNYTVSGSTTFEIKPKSIEDALITLSGKLTYNGTEQTQNVTVSLAGFDTVTFDVSCNKQTNVKASGNYTLTVTGNGNFAGTKTLDWNIAPATPTENSAKKTTAKVLKNSALAGASVTKGEILALDGKTPLAGTFAWVDGAKVMSAHGTEQMIFTPENTNYAPITIDVAVIVYSSAPIRYIVKFDTNGGNSIANQTVVKNGEVTKPANPTRDGYIFGGWYTDKELTEKYDFTKAVTKNIILYAKWVREEWKNPFSDVNKGDWFYDDVAYVYDKGLMGFTSMNLFSPNKTTTRGMVVTILYRLDGSPAVSSYCPFDDVPSGAYYRDAAIWAVENGITKGYGNDLFKPNDSITREQLATFLYRYAKYKGIDVSVGEDTDILSYNDARNISEYAFPAMQWLCDKGIMQGSNGNLKPAGNGTRAQIAALLHRFCEKILNG